MISYFAVGSIVLYFSFVSSYYKKDRLGLLYTFVLIFLFLAFRYNYGNDYPGYVALFNRINKDFITTIKSTYLEAGWILLNRIFGPFGFYSLVIFLAFINCIIYYQIIKRFVVKKYYLFAVFLYYFNSYFFLIQLSAMRQGLAIVLFLYALSFILQKKYFIGFLILLLASTFHASALFLVPIIIVLLFLNFKIRTRHIVLIEGLLISLYSVGYIYKGLFIEIATSLFGERYSYYEDAGTNPGIVNIIIYSTLLFVILFYFNKLSQEYKLFAKLFIVGLFFMPIGFILPISSRMALYFLPLSILVYPKLLEIIQSNIIRSIFILAVVAVISLRLYTFFVANWQYYSTYSTILNPLLNK